MKQHYADVFFPLIRALAGAGVQIYDYRIYGKDSKVGVLFMNPLGEICLTVIAKDDTEQVIDSFITKDIMELVDVVLRNL